MIVEEKLTQLRRAINENLRIHHKSHPRTYQAFAIDIGCYAHMRKLQGRFNELDLAQSDAKEKMRSAPILNPEEFEKLWGSAPADAESALRSEDEEGA